jgi:hypothetical protein
VESKVLAAIESLMNLQWLGKMRYSQLNCQISACFLELLLGTEITVRNLK